MPNDEKLSLAYHESGHAVSFYLQGFAVKFMTIVPALDGSSEGRTEPLFDWGALDSESKENQIAILKRKLVCVFCGMIAEGYLQQAANPENPITPDNTEHILQVGRGDLKDRDEILDWLRKLGEDADKYKQWAIQEAITLVPNHWREIEGLGKHLLVEKSLLRGEVELILFPFGIVK